MLEESSKISKWKTHPGSALGSVDDGAVASHLQNLKKYRVVRDGMQSSKLHHSFEKYGQVSQSAPLAQRLVHEFMTNRDGSNRVLDKQGLTKDNISQVNDAVKNIHKN